MNLDAGPDAGRGRAGPARLSSTPPGGASGAGYDGATIRGIAADAGVNPALVHHFYGTKERLFAAAMRLPVVPSDIITFVLGAERDRLGDEFLPRLGEVLTGTMLRTWDMADIRTAFLGLLRSAATSEQGVTAARVRDQHDPGQPGPGGGAR